jgi:hypothetical protein
MIFDDYLIHISNGIHYNLTTILIYQMIKNRQSTSKITLINHNEQYSQFFIYIHYITYIYINLYIAFHLLFLL